MSDTTSDPVSHPAHYTSHPSGIETIQITKHESFLRGNVLKYVLRAPYKGTELQDLEKARQYLDWEIERVEAREHSKRFKKCGCKFEEICACGIRVNNPLGV